jgi:hypothetical protein
METIFDAVLLKTALAACRPLMSIPNVLLQPR